MGRRTPGAKPVLTHQVKGDGLEETTEVDEAIAVLLDDLELIVHALEKPLVCRAMKELAICSRQVASVLRELSKQVRPLSATFRSHTCNCRKPSSREVAVSKIVAKSY